MKNECLVFWSWTWQDAFSFNVNHDPWFVILARTSDHATELSTSYLELMPCQRCRWQSAVRTQPQGNVKKSQKPTPPSSFRESPFRGAPKESHIANVKKHQPNNNSKGVKSCSLVSLFLRFILWLNNLITRLCSKSSNIIKLLFKSRPPETPRIFLVPYISYLLLSWFLSHKHTSSKTFGGDW